MYGCGGRCCKPSPQSGSHAGPHNAGWRTAIAKAARNAGRTWECLPHSRRGVDVRRRPPARLPVWQAWRLAPRWAVGRTRGSAPTDAIGLSRGRWVKGAQAGWKACPTKRACHTTRVCTTRRGWRQECQPHKESVHHGGRGEIVPRRPPAGSCRCGTQDCVLHGICRCGKPGGLLHGGQGGGHAGPPLQTRLGGRGRWVKAPRPTGMAAAGSKACPTRTACPT